jgi:hypothetical protein
MYPNNIKQNSARRLLQTPLRGRLTLGFPSQHICSVAKICVFWTFFATNSLTYYSKYVDSIEITCGLAQDGLESETITAAAKGGDPHDQGGTR